MALVQAVLLVDHENAAIQRLGNTEVTRLHAHHHHTRQHGSDVRTGHAFFGEVCDALAGITEVLVAGHHTAQTDFRHYLDKHRPQVARQVVGWETVDRPSDGQLAALARKFFEKHDQMLGRHVTAAS